MPNSEGSFIRWQGIAITQMGYAVNLMLTFAAASLGFTLTLFKDPSRRQHCWGRCFIVFAAVALTASIAIGLWCVLNRLRDFRESAQIARRRERWEKEGCERSWIDVQLQRRRNRNRRRGRRSYRLFNWQIGSFAVGVLLLVAAVIDVYGV